MSTRFYDFGPFRIDKLNHVLLRDGKTVPLKPKVFDTLLVLIENRDRVLEKDGLMSQLWPDTVVEEANLSQNIYLLRKVLGEDPDGDTYIATLPKRGYRFVATVNEVEDGRAIPEIKTEDVFSPPQQVSRLQKPIMDRRVSATALVLGLLLSLAFAVAYIRNKRGSTTSAQSTRVQSLAVLPFKPLGSDAINEVQGFGMADTLITRLSNTRKIVVRPTSAVRKFRSPEQDPVAAGLELKVDAVLDASVQRVGDKLRVTMQLVRVSDGTSLWAGKFDQEASDLLAVQDRLSEQVAQTLIPQMTGEEQTLFSKRYTESPDAYQFYMMGRYHWSRINREDWTKAIDYFNRAIEKDRNYALAYAGLADAYLSIIADSSLPKSETIPKAKQAAMTALQLDDRLPEAHVSLGRIKAYYDWDWAGAGAEFKRAIELNPNSSDTHREYAGYLTAILQTEEAITEAKRARDIDPLSQLNNYHVAWALISARRYDEAIQQSEQVLRTFPQAHLWIGWANIGKRKYDEAIMNFEARSRALGNDPVTTANLGYAFGVAGRRNEAEKVLAELKKLSEQHQASPYLVAIVYSGLGDKNQTFAWLDKAYQERSRLLGHGLKVSPVWDSLRTDPRFAELLRRVGLPE